MSNIVNRFPVIITIGNGTEANLTKSTTYPEQYEVAQASDTGRLFIGDSANRFQKWVKYLYPDIVCNADQTVINNDEVVWV